MSCTTPSVKPFLPGLTGFVIKLVVKVSVPKGVTSVTDTSTVSEVEPGSGQGRQHVYGDNQSHAVKSRRYKPSFQRSVHRGDGRFFFSDERRAWTKNKNALRASGGTTAHRFDRGLTRQTVWVSRNRDGCDDYAPPDENCLLASA